MTLIPDHDRVQYLFFIFVESETTLFLCGVSLLPEPKEELLSIVTPVVVEFGAKIVELSRIAKKSGVGVYLIVWKEPGVGINDCAFIHRNVYPVLEKHFGGIPFSLEVSSPGLSRNLKNFGEFGVFLGRKVKVLLFGRSEWVSGRIFQEEEGAGVVLKTGAETFVLSESNVLKAKLDEI